MSDGFDEAIHVMEKEAILGDRMAIMRLLGALRVFRAARVELLNKRYRDGEVDAAALDAFDTRTFEALSEVKP